ncbi:MAG: hypothetical protein ACE5GW_07450 [Planctomycetota bacterium]
MSPDKDESGLAVRLGGSRVGLRPELEFTRHLFRGRVSYIIRDPVTFESHRLDHGDYEILVSIQPDQELSQTFAGLVESGKLDQDQEEDFYLFIVSLHRLGFLHLPISDGKRIYQRFIAKQKQKRKQRLMGIFFLQVPLINPEGFLCKTIRRSRFIFSRTFFLLWLALVASACFVAARQWGALTGQIGDLFDARNIPVLWLAIIALKAMHELGHAYACKNFGGHVPEMGVFLIAFTPCAYVDATASWGFTRKRDRLIVGLAGMYVELFVASIALLIWSSTSPGFLNSLMHKIVFLASAVTVGFNLNPLMRFDGYYVLSDLLELPNLRQRANRAVASLAKRLALGMKAAAGQENLKTQTILCLFGVLSSLYRVTVVLGISALIAMKFFLVGILLGGTYVGMELLKLLRKIAGFLWWSPETASIRARAVAVSVLLFGGGGAFLFLIPLPSHVRASGIVAAEQETVLRAEAAGFLRRLHIEPGERLEAGDLIAELEDLGARVEVVEAEARLAEAQLLAEAMRTFDRQLAQKAEETVNLYREKLADRLREREKLTVQVVRGGRVIDCRSIHRSGDYLKVGDEIATVAAGRWRVEAYLSGREVSAASPRLGKRVEFRAAGDPARVHAGTIVRLKPEGSNRVDAVELTEPGGGSIQVNPQTSEAQQTYFKVTVMLDDDGDSSLRHGMTGKIRIDATSEPIALLVYRSLLIFLQRLDTS